jgi:NAD+ synthase
MEKKIVNWIKKQVRLTKAKGIVIGLSGGLDSSVVACLAKEAVGKNRILALILPCHSKNEDLEDAKLVTERLGIRTKTVDLSKIYDNLIKILPKANKLALANLKPRLRMLTLYYFANKLNYLVCGTGNKSEYKLGYFTKFGDAGADILPLGDLLKTQVRKLAKKLGIPKHIITKPPTAGLWPGQTDESEMGITYAELDDILERIENKREQILAPEKVSRIKQMVKKSEHKRQGPPICYI